MQTINGGSFPQIYTTETLQQLHRSSMPPYFIRKMSNLEARIQFVICTGQVNVCFADAAAAAAAAQLKYHSQKIKRNTHASHAH